jgi:hypothetical protein
LSPSPRFAAGGYGSLLHATLFDPLGPVVLGGVRFPIGDAFTTVDCSFGSLHLPVLSAKDKAGARLRHAEVFE